ncbi:MAG: hypothetical protein GC161_09430 [Planctomycetaceae bacterium]|nr:hypothetical protein [Planctomycetaceae bacterium]
MPQRAMHERAMTQRSVLLALLALALAGGAWLGCRWIGTPGPRAVDPEAAAGAGEKNPVEFATAPPLIESARGPTTPTLHPQDLPQRAQVAAAAEPGSAEEAHGRAPVRVRGRLFTGTGTVAAGAELVARSTAARPESWELRGAPDAEGRFELALPVAPGQGAALHAVLEGHVRASWDWFEPPAGALIELGDVHLVRGARVRGRLVDRRGGAPGSGWQLVAESTWRTEGDGGNGYVDSAPIAEDGAFVLDGVPPGALTLWATFSSLAQSERETVQAREGEEFGVTLTHTGADPRRSLGLHVRTEPVELFHHGGLPLVPGSLRLDGPTESLDLVLPDGRIDRAALEDLPTGPYSVTFEDPRFESVRRDGLEPGRSWTLTTRGRGAVRLAVRDRATQEPVPEVRVQVELEDWPSTHNRGLLHAHGPLPDDGVLWGLPPWPVRLVVDAPGYGMTVVSLGLVQTGEVREVDVELGAPTRLEVRVVAAGAAVSHAQVVLAAVPDSPGVVFFPSTSAGSTDSQGELVFADVKPGLYQLFAQHGVGRVAQAGPARLVAGEDKQVVLDVGAAAYLGVRVGAPTEELLARYRVSAELLGRHGSFPGEFETTATSAAPVGDRFAVVPLGAGSYRLSLLSDGSVLAGGLWLAAKPNGLTLGDVTLQAGERREVFFDLRENFPGSAALTIRINDVPAAGSVVHLLRLEPRASAEARVDNFGVARFDGLGEGRWWPVLVHMTAADRWAVPLEPAFDVVRAGETRAEYAVRTAPGTLRLVDASGAPWASKQCLLLPSPEWEVPRRVRVTSFRQTDEQGELSLTLPHGEYVLFTGSLDHTVVDGDRLGGQRVTWPPAGAPLVLEVAPH